MKPKRIVSTSQDLNLVQDAVAEIVSKLSPLVFELTVLGPIHLVSGVNTVPHTLERVLQGWIVVRRSNGAVIYDEQTSNKLPSVTLKLNSSADVTVWLLVF